MTDNETTSQPLSRKVYKPRFITFTGVDEHTNLLDLYSLSLDYPIEIGILFSPKNQGKENRYPGLQWIRETVEKLPVNFSAHLCGGDAKNWILNEQCQHDLSKFKRVQINTREPVNPTKVGMTAAVRNLRAVIQNRGEFPQICSVDVLFDQSGGRGVAPEGWPSGVNSTLCGYAGGINPSNAASVVKEIGAKTRHYWIDMESGVRDDQDWFSVSKCREVCEAVYGKPLE
jgi:hypothetical protein